MTVELSTYNKEFEQNALLETERKFIPVFPEQLSDLRTQSRPIEQIYLSNPSEPFSLRIRETLQNDGSLLYEATLKDKGVLGPDGLRRLEVSTQVDASMYAYYMSDETPVVRKLRAEPIQGVIVDFFEDGSVQVESESAEAWKQFTSEFGDAFVDISGDLSGTNEWRAHLSFRRNNNGKEAFVIEPDLRADDIIRDILRKQNQPSPVIAHIGGRSGSGKSTIVQEVHEKLRNFGFQPIVLSTDDYHRGASWLQDHNNGLPWEHWDAPVVYDTATLANDLIKLTSGQPIYRRTIDWTTVEPIYTDLIEPSDVILVEGIYAMSPDITKPDDLSYEMTTPLATCIGRRLLRDMRERPQFADPSKSLGYMLREAEPAYQAQK